MAGGEDYDNYPDYHLDTSEIMRGTEGFWRTMEAKLLRILIGLRGATINNIVYMTGKGLIFCMISLRNNLYAMSL